MMPTIAMPPIEWNLIAPFVLLAIGGILVTVLAVGPAAVRRYTGYVAIASLVPPAVAVSRLWDLAGAGTQAMGGMIVVDHFTLCFQMLFLATAALALLLALPMMEDDWRERRSEDGEYSCLVIFATLGMMLMASSGNLLMIFLGLEILSLPLYILSGFARWQDRPLEASMKYFLLGAFSTGFTIYGMALMYASTGTLDLGSMSGLAASMGPHGSTTLLLGFGLTIIGFLFKIAAFPFHYWMPDVYQGAPTTVTAYMIAGTKAAAFAAVLRIVTAPLFWDGPFTADWVKLLTVIAALTMTAGNTVALVQSNIKRMLAYSGIAHAGYLMIALVARSDDGVSSIVFYLVAYMFMNLGAFAVVVAVDRSRGGAGEGDMIASYAGMGRRHPVLAAAMAVFMLSLTGVPLTGGFLGKFFIFKAAVDSSLYGLAIVGLLNSALAAAYYLNVVLTIYMKEPISEPPRLRTPVPLGLGIAVSLAGVFYLGVFPGRIMEFVRDLLL